MKKAISIVLCAVILVCSAFAMAGCTKQNEIKSDIVLITDGDNIKDGGYNQSAWDGICSYADENSMTYKYFQPALNENGELTTDTVEKYVDLAVNNGAKFIVLPGEAFAVSAYEVAPVYPDVKFVLLDAIPHSADDNTNRFVQNVMSVSFDALQSGYLAGYVAVANGNKELGFFGEVKSDNSANYGAGFVQGAAYAAETLGVPVTLDWADYDSPLRDFDYGFTVKACYDKIADAKEETFNVKVENGQGSGTYTKGSNVTITADPAPKGQVFDKWEVKSNTDGVKDKKVNISSKSKSSMNLLVEKCDCTITAAYKDIEGDYYTVDVMSADGNSVYSSVSVSADSQCDIVAPAAPANMVFDCWKSSVKDVVEDVNASSTKVNVTNKNVTLTPVYKLSETPTYYVTVETGEGGNGESTGSGSYVAGDMVNVYAAAPKDGYMFSHWENTDYNGDKVSVAMENEYYWNTSFEMIDRYASVCEEMYDHGATVVFAGGNSKADSAFTAKSNYDYDLNVISAGEENGDAYTTVVNDYGQAVKDCLSDYQGGTVIAANCATKGIYSTFVSDDEKIQKNYEEIYNALADGTLTPVLAEGGAGYDFCKAYEESKPTNCLTVNGRFLEAVSVDAEKK